MFFLLQISCRFTEVGSICRFYRKLPCPHLTDKHKPLGKIPIPFSPGLVGTCSECPKEVCKMTKNMRCRAKRYYCYLQNQHVLTGKMKRRFTSILIQDKEELKELVKGRYFTWKHYNYTVT